MCICLQRDKNIRLSHTFLTFNGNFLHFPECFGPKTIPLETPVHSKSVGGHPISV